MAEPERVGYSLRLDRTYEATVTESRQTLQTGEFQIIVQAMGLDSSEQDRFQKSLAEWEAAVTPFVDAVRRAELITEQDLAIRINVRDYE